MASLEKLAIRGIRSFSPDEEQTIEFYSPLTMIVGQNGSGKTTIIECLKYACTGKLPPGGGTTGGQSWVHDPKLADATEVKASVKLRFRAVDEKRMVVVRSLQLQYKARAKNPTFRQLEGVIRTVNPITKKSENMSHKCTDLNSFVPQATGISSAILESVVFCHQEESSWPLQDPATLKKKFDEIFESTRYTKALEAIDKCKKAKNDEYKQSREQLAALTENREAAVAIKQELAAKAEEVEKMEKEQQTIMQRIENWAKKRDEATSAARKLEDLGKQMETKLMLLEERDRSLKEKLASLGKEMRDSTEELEERLASFSSDQKETEAELSRMQAKRQAELKGLENARALMTRLEGEKGAILVQLKQQEGLVEDRNKDILALSKAYNLTPPKPLAHVGSGPKALQVELSESELKRFVKDLQAKAAHVAKELERFRAENARQLEKKQAEVTEIQSKLGAIELTKQAKQREMEEYERSQVAIADSQQDRMPVAASSLDLAKNDAARARKEYQDLADGKKDREFDKKVAELEREIRELEYQAGQERDLLQTLRATAKSRVELDQKQRRYKHDKEVLEERCRQFNESYREKMEKDVEATLDSLQNAVIFIQDTLIGGQTREIAQAQESEKALVGKISAAKANLERDQEELKAADLQIEKMQESRKAREVLKKIKAVLGKEVETLEEAIDGMADQYLAVYRNAVWEGKSLVYKGLGKIVTEEQTCPCCEAKMDQEGCQRLVGTLSKKEENAGKKKGGGVDAAAAAGELLKELFEASGDIKALGPAREKVKRLAARTEELQEGIKKMQAEKEQVKRGIDRMQLDKKRLEQMYNEAKLNQNEGAKVFTLDGEIATSRMTLTACGDGDGRSMEEVEQSVEANLQAKDSKQRELNTINNKRSVHQRQLVHLSTLARDMEDRYNKLTKDMAEYQRLEKERAVLKERMEEARQAVSTALNEEIPLRSEQKKLQAEYDRFKKKLGEEDAEKHRVQMELQQRLASFEQLQRRTRDAEAADNPGKLKQLEDKAEGARRDMAGCQERMEAMAPRIEQARKLLQDKDALRRQIEDNLAYRRMVEDKKAEERQMAKLQEQLGKMEEKSEIYHALRIAEDGYRKACEQKVKSEATVDTLRRIQQEQQGKLRSEKYHKIEKRYREVRIKVDTVQMAIQDLTKYHKALDRALMQYHSIKIEEINKIIRELWTRTYQGNDIEDIAIVSGEEGGGRATRSYNYRVVMKKGPTYLDMRGRCSAGQRVLASIVIRLALAETFCVNCGVMTLDEPTTNLDHENKGGLARALARLIAERSRQQNFQLVIITHDEEFVETMKQELSTISGFSMPEHYFRISRKEATHGRAYSRIEQVEWA